MIKDIEKALENDSPKNEKRILKEIDRIINERMDELDDEDNVQMVPALLKDIKKGHGSRWLCYDKACPCN